jgi:hypothetical protein
MPRVPPEQRPASRAVYRRARARRRAPGQADRRALQPPVDQHQQRPHGLLLDQLWLPLFLHARQPCPPVHGRRVRRRAGRSNRPLNGCRTVVRGGVRQGVERPFVAGSPHLQGSVLAPVRTGHCWGVGAAISVAWLSDEQPRPICNRSAASAYVIHVGLLTERVSDARTDGCSSMPFALPTSRRAGQLSAVILAPVCDEVCSLGHVWWGRFHGEPSHAVRKAAYRTEFL